MRGERKEKSEMRERGDFEERMCRKGVDEGK